MLLIFGGLTKSRPNGRRIHVAIASTAVRLQSASPRCVVKHLSVRRLYPLPMVRAAVRSLSRLET